jgi:hypothetical protein
MRTFFASCISTLAVVAFANVAGAQEPNPTSEPAATRPAEPVAPSSAGPDLLPSALGAVAITGLGVGSYFAVQAVSNSSKANAECPSFDGQLRCTSSGVASNDTARTDAMVSGAAFALGVAAAVGTVVVLVLDHNAKSAPQVAFSPRGIELGARW